MVDATQLAKNVVGLQVIGNLKFKFPKMTKWMQFEFGKMKYKPKNKYTGTLNAWWKQLAKTGKGMDWYR